MKPCLSSDSALSTPVSCMYTSAVFSRLMKKTMVEHGNSQKRASWHRLLCFWWGRYCLTLDLGRVLEAYHQYCHLQNDEMVNFVCHSKNHPFCWGCQSVIDILPDVFSFLGGVDNLLHGSTLWLRGIQWISWTLNTIISSEVKYQDRWTELLMLLHTHSMTLHCTTHHWNPHDGDPGRPPCSNAVLDSRSSPTQFSLVSPLVSLSSLTETQAKKVCWCIVMQSRVIFFFIVVKSRPFANGISTDFKLCVLICTTDKLLFKLTCLTI